MMKISATNRSSGEVVELPVDDYAQVIKAWQIAQEYAKVADSLKDQLKKLVPSYVADNGLSEVKDGFMFRVSNVQRYNYDKAVLRQVLNEDDFDLLLVPHKPTVDTFIKEHLSELGEKSTLLRNSMVAEGKPYRVIKLERVDRDE